MKPFILLFTLLASMICGCGDAISGYSSRSDKGGPDFPHAQPASGASIVVPADQKVFEVQIISRQTDLTTQLSELTTARDALQNAVTNVGELVAFRVADPTIQGAYPRHEKDDRSDYNALAVQVVFKQPTDPLKQISDFVKAVGKIKPAAGALWRIHLQSSSSSFSSPENYREQLVTQAMDGLKGLKSVDTSRFRVTLNGLEKPLVVAQCSDTEFLISLQYTITVESVAEKPAKTD